MAIIDIYDKITRIDLVFTETSAPNWNPIMNQNHFRVQKGTLNHIEFKIRNNDRRPVNLLGKSLQCNINYPDGHTHLLRKKLEVIDPIKGLVRLSIFPFEMFDWPLGPLSFNVTLDTEDGHCRMLYVTESDSAFGWFYVDDGPYLGPTPTMTSGLYRDQPNNSPQTYCWFSDVLPGSNRAYNPDGLMSLVIVTDNYSGTMTALGSLETNIPQFTDDVWFPLNLDGTSHSSMKFNRETGTHLITMEANVEWVIFQFTADDFNINSVDQVPGQGAFDLADQIPSIQFRNY